MRSRYTARLGTQETSEVSKTSEVWARGIAVMKTTIGVAASWIIASPAGERSHTRKEKP